MKWVVALAPLIILQLILLAAALADISRREQVTGGNKVPWIILVVLVNTIGPIVYFIFGRREAD